MTRAAFITTKEHRRFVEFADAVRKGHTVGLCFGPAGVGKTQSARRYAHWDQIDDAIDDWCDGQTSTNAAMAKARTLFYTPTPLTTQRQLHDELNQLFHRVYHGIEQHLEAAGKAQTGPYHRRKQLIELVIVDESERLSAGGLELLRDRYDRDNIALILIGMPGIEKQFSRYAQFYSRVGFAHGYRPLGTDELRFVLERQWRKLGQELNLDDFTDAQAVAAITRITRGNFRLLERLFTQIRRIMKINELQTVTNDVVEAAASTLVIGPT